MKQFLSWHIHLIILLKRTIPLSVGLALIFEGLVPILLPTSSGPVLTGTTIGSWLAPVPVARAQLAQNLCYAVADSGDTLVTVDRNTGTPTTVIGATGTANVEAIGWNSTATILYAADANRLGTLNLSTGTFTAVSGSTFGTARGALGNHTIADVDGLAVDPFTGIMYGSERRGGASLNDLLFQVDVASGTFVADAFGSGVDYLEIDTGGLGFNIWDIDDLAVDPTDGQLYGLANNGGGNDRLVKIDKVTGAVTDVGRLTYSGTPVNDMEGYSFYNDGTFYGTTGSSSNSLGPTNFSNTLWEIDQATGNLTLIGQFTTGSDYEAAGCLVGGANAVTGTVFADRNRNGTLEPATDVGAPNVTVRLYVDENNDGQVDVGDTLIQSLTSDANGDYQFDIATTGHFVLDIDQSTLPAGETGTSTDNVEEADFATLGNTDAGNDFGYIEGGIIGDFVWNDADEDGKQDANEEPISGVTVSLYEDADATCGTGDETLVGVGTTEADGIYYFGGINDTNMLTTTTIVTSTVYATPAVSSDDAEQNVTNGNMYLNSSDLEFVNDGNDQYIGIRFLNVAVPSGATISNAYIQFTADESQSVATSLTILGQDADNPGTFTSANSDISNRPRTTASVSWPNINSWTTGSSGSDQRTPNLNQIVQEIVDRSGWASGNAMVFLFGGSGHRTADSEDSGNPPELAIEYQSETGSTTIPVTPFTDYCLTISDTDPQLTGYTRTQADYGGNAGDSDFNDSDATAGSGNFNGLSVISVTTGAANEYDHSFDFGYLSLSDLTATKTLVAPSGGVAKPGDRFTFDLNVENTGSMTVTQVTLEDTFASSYMSYQSASVTPTVIGSSYISWTGTITGGVLQPYLPLAPGGIFTITTEFVAKEP